MIVTLSERRFAALIRSLEPTTANDSDEEILERIAIYSKRLFSHIATFGVRIVGLVSQRNGIADFRFTFTDPPYSQGDSRQPYIEALSMLNPICVTVEPADLPQLVPAPGMASIFRDHWTAISEHITKILPSEVIPKLEECASAIVFQGGATVPPELAEVGYTEWALQNNVPLHNSHELREQRKQAEIDARRAANDRRIEERDRNQSDWFVREMD